MPDDIIDIVHRLSYQVEDGDLRDARTEVDKNVQAVKKLERENEELRKVIKKTSVYETRKREGLKKTLRENIKEVEKLKKALANVHKSSVPAAKGMSNMGKATNQAANTMRSFSYIARDAPYGIMGISNNITQLTDNFGYLKREVGSSKAAFKALLNSFMGPAGMAVGFSIVISLITSLARKYGGLDKAIEHLLTSTSDLEKRQDDLNKVYEEAGDQFANAIVKVNQLRMNIDAARKGFIDKDEVVKEYNSTLGKTIGSVNSLDEAEKKLEANADAYIQFTFLKAAANEALKKSSEDIVKSQIEQRKSAFEEVNIWDVLLNRAKNILTNPLSGGGPGLDVDDLQKSGEKRRKKIISEADKDAKAYQDIAEELHKKAVELAKKYGFDFFGNLENGGKENKEKNKENKFVLPFLSGLDEAAIKEYRDKLKETITIFDAHWADYKQKIAERYRKGEISKEQFNTRMVSLEVVRLKKVETLLKDASQRAPYVQFFKDQLAQIQKQQGDLSDQLKMSLGKATLAPMSQAWQDYADSMSRATKVSQDNANKMIDYYAAISNAATRSFQDIIASDQRRAQMEIQIEQSRVQRAQQIADRGNAEALQKEEERLNQAQKQQERFARSQVALNAIQTESNAILAVIKAAGEGGVLAPATIALVIAAIASGIVAVKNLTSDMPGFKEGIIDLQGPGTERSDSIPSRLSKGESVMTADATKKNKSILERMNEGQRFAMLEYGKTPPLLIDLPLKTAPKQSNYQDKINRHILSELKDIRQTIANKKEASMFIDRRGVAAITVDYLEETRRKNSL